jgi:uncharacterized protein (DUF2126 family)
MKTAKVNRVLAALYIPPGVHNVVAQAKTIAAEVAANPGYFPSPSPSLAVINADIAAVDAAEIVAQTKAKGAVEIRDAKLRVLIEHLHALKTYVQQVANADHANAEAIITAAAMHVTKPKARAKQDLAVKQGKVSGTVTVTAKSGGPRATYYWQHSTDEKTWTDLPDTMQARFTMTGLAVPMMHYFRNRILTPKGGKSDWGQIVSLMVT